MKSTIAAVLAVSSTFLFSLDATSATPPVAPATPASAPAAARTPLPKTANLVVHGWSSAVPQSWTPYQPANSMRVAEYAVPAAAGAAPGEVVVYFFNTGDGGSHDANIQRWSSEFTGADGKPVAPQVSVGKSDAGELTLVTLHGNYARGAGMMAVSGAKAGQTLLVAMVETAAGRIALHLSGPDATVAAQRDGFLKLARGFRASAT